MSVLVTCASKHGGTQGIATRLAERLRVRGLDVDERPIAAVTDPAEYDAVVLGSGVYAGSWMKEASTFAHRHGAALSAMPTWLFSSGPTGPDTEHAVSDKQAAKLEESVHPRDHREFGGVLDANALGFVERKVIRMVKAPEGDFRDWDAIVAYADEIADALARDLTPAPGARA